MALTHENLKSTLWEAANTLRGSAVDRTDWKGYILPLLFFKRLSDVWDEDYQQAFEDTGDAGYSAATANDHFKIPEGAHWKDVRTASRDVGRALLNAFQAIEAANPERLRGVFGNAPWTDKAQMPDGTLKNLIEHSSKHPLSLANVPEDELGTVRGRQRPHGAGVLHQPHAGPPHGADAGAASVMKTRWLRSLKRCQLQRDGVGLARGSASSVTKKSPLLPDGTLIFALPTYALVMVRHSIRMNQGTKNAAGYPRIRRSGPRCRGKKNWPNRA